jgi:hypothetical protein
MNPRIRRPETIIAEIIGTYARIDSTIFTN